MCYEECLIRLFKLVRLYINIVAIRNTTAQIIAVYRLKETLLPIVFILEIMLYEEVVKMAVNKATMIELITSANNTL